MALPSGLGVVRVKRINDEAYMNAGDLALWLELRADRADDPEHAELLERLALVILKAVK